MISLDNTASQNSDSQTLIPAVGINWSNKAAIAARARIVGERIVLKGLEKVEPLATNPLIIRAGMTGCAVLLRYGIIVTFDLSAEEESELVEMLRPHIREPLPSNVSEELAIAFRSQAEERPKERLEGNTLWLQECSAERLQIVAEALGKSVALDYYETEVSSLFERIKPFTTAIQGKNLRPPKEKELLSYIGGMLLIQQKMLGIVEVGEKPDPVWDYPELDRLYLRLENEYELRERLVALEQKLALVSRTVETSLGVLQRDSSHRVEWYIVILIVVEIVLSIYDMWFRQ
ncbi:RMD1 family protein [Leptolyngbya sp. BC1307]|uniref:RMD1 family protein n=1 Tax=Leptolyngbya sp. BC1307 TaxID=2029589 RepID=UPI000EFCCFE8|nr:RMD1 family protein [Leptolyngbya sp. BC1307]